MNIKKVEHAMLYAKLGWKVFPCHSIINGKCSCNESNCSKPGKHPRTRNGFKDASTDKAIIEKWWKMWPEANIGCATGIASGIVVLDLDKKHGRSSKEFDIPVTVCVRTGGGGEHFMFKHPGGHIKSTNGQLFGEGVDVKADGGYVILAPSSHISGNCYEWILSPENENLAEIPEWLLKAIQTNNQNGESPSKLWQKDPSAILEGTRNDTAASMAGKLLQSLPPELIETAGWAGLVAWNNSIPEPLTQKELLSVWQSVGKYKNDSEEDKGKESQASSLLKTILKRSDLVLFHDEQGDGYISLEIDGHQEIWPCKSKALRKWISKEMYSTQKRAPGSEAIKSVLAVLEGNACYSGSEYKLHNRTYWDGKELWYDLCNKEWQSIKINRDGWELVDKPPIIFRRYSHHKLQTLPSKENGNAKLFLNYVNINDSQHKLLLMVYLVSCFIPDFPHALLIIFGSQGSAKSTLSKLLRDVIDPSVIEVASMPESNRELIQTLAHHAFLFFDNVSYISETTSDTLCKAVTGGGFPKRELYSDDEDIIYSFMRCVGINGINLVATRPDLLERSLLLELERIEPNQRKQEKEILLSFQKDLPLIIGGVFDVLVKAIKMQPTIKVDSLPRMADFAMWGCAIAKALGYTQEEFLEAYRINIAKQTETVLNENIVASAILSFMADTSLWTGTATELLRDLNSFGDFEFETHEKYWPRGANVLTRRLNDLKVTLKDAGILYTSVPGNKREITLKRLDANVDCNGTNDVSEGLLGAMRHD
jgi:hypothetical protein